MTKIIFNSLMICCLCFAGISCSDSKHPSKLVGKWERNIPGSYNGKTGWLNGFPDGTVEFLKDGKFVLRFSVATWEVSDNRLFIKYKDGDHRVYGYQVSGSELRLTQSGDYDHAIYRKR